MKLQGENSNFVGLDLLSHLQNLLCKKYRTPKRASLVKKSILKGRNKQKKKKCLTFAKNAAGSSAMTSSVISRPSPSTLSTSSNALSCEVAAFRDCNASVHRIPSSLRLLNKRGTARRGGGALLIAAEMINKRGSVIKNLPLPRL